MRVIKRFYDRIKLFFYSFFVGLNKADKLITSQVDSSNGIEVINTKTNNENVFSNMLEQKQTQQVKEMVDSHYRIYRESNKYDTSSMKIIGFYDDGFPIFDTSQKLSKKSVGDFLQHPPVFNPDDLKIITIQDNRHLEDNYETSKALYTYDTTLKVVRDNFTPRFKIEKLVKKMVVRECDKNKVLVDLYLPSEASQFGKIDAIVVSNLHNLKDSNTYKSDLTDLMEMSWFSDKAWNTEDILLFKYKVSELIGINIYDGNFVLTYVCDIIENGKDLTEQHRTKELDEKYKNNSPKQKGVDIFAYERKLKRDKEKNKDIDLNNFSSTILKINENSD